MVVDDHKQTRPSKMLILFRRKIRIKYETNFFVSSISEKLYLMIRCIRIIGTRVRRTAFIDAHNLFVDRVIIL